MGTQIKVRASFDVMKNVLAGDLILDGSENMHDSGAKIYYRGGGWWAVGGYHFAGLDVDETVGYIILNKELEILTTTNAPGGRWHSHVPKRRNYDSKTI
jgi:hypothetical protein